MKSRLITLSKRVLTAALCFLLAAGSIACGNPSLLKPFPMPESDGGGEVSGGANVLRFLELLRQQNYAEMDDLFDPLARVEIQRNGGAEAYFTPIFEQIGPFEIIGDVREIGRQGSYIAYAIDIETGDGNQVFQATVSATGKLLNLSFQPAVEVEAPIAMPDDFEERDIAVDAGTGYPLKGALVIPKQAENPVPAVVLVQGSGAHGPDEIVGANRVFGQIARGLAMHGVATLRYEKRSYAYPEIMGKTDYSVQEEYVEDVLAAVALLKEQQGIDPTRIYILGHSLGGMLAPMFVEAGADVSGVILLAGSPRSLIDIMKDQQADYMQQFRESGQQEALEQMQQNQEKWNKEYEHLKTLTAEEAKQAGTVFETGAYYMYVLEQYDSITAIKNAKIPTLILQGAKDMQVYADRDYKAYQDALGQETYVTCRLYENLNHLFMPSSATNLAEAQAEYLVHAQIPDTVFADIAAFIRGES